MAYRIYYFLSGVFSSLDENNLQDVKSERTQNTDPNKDTDSSKTDVPDQKNLADTDRKPVVRKSKTKLPPQINQEQINILAEKVLRIHGVEPESDDEENQKNIDELRKVVANVEKDLNEKLKLTKTQAKAKKDTTVPETKEPTLGEVQTLRENETSDRTNQKIFTKNDNSKEPPILNENVSETDPQSSETTNTEKDKTVEVQDKANEQIAIESNIGDNNENETPDKTDENISTKNDNSKESQILNENISETNQQSSETTNTEKDITVEVQDKANEKVAIESNTDDSNENNEIEKETERIVENPEKIEQDIDSQNSSENKLQTTAEVSETTADEDEDINAEKEPNTDSSISDDTEESVSKTENDVGSVENNNSSTIDDVAETKGYKEEVDTAQEGDIVQRGVNSDENEIEIEGDTVEEIGKNDQNNSHEEISEEYTKNEVNRQIEGDTVEEIGENEHNSSNEEISEEYRENEDSSSGITAEEEISGSCSANEECSQVDENKPHAYTEEYNAPEVKEEELEIEIEDTHLQRVVKFFSSFLN